VKLNHINLSVFFTILGVFGLPSVSHGALLFDVNTASYPVTVGPLNGGYSTANVPFEIYTTGSASTTRAYLGGNNLDVVGLHVYNQANDTAVCVAFGAVSAGAGGTSYEQSVLSQFGVSPDMNEVLYNASYDNPGETIPPCSTISFTAGIAYTARIFVSGYSSGQFDALGSSGGTLSDVFFEVSTDGSFPDPIISLYNEVLSYTPSDSFSTSTGTTTIGSTFSLSGASDITGVLYRLYSSNGVVLAEEELDYTTPGIYEIEFDYNFTATSTYQARAFFLQEINGSIQEYPNLTAQFIYVGQLPGVGSVTIGPDGYFIFPGGIGGTTSTSSLSDLTGACDVTEGFANSICNFIYKAVVPSPGSLSGVSGAYSQLALKAPFSFINDTLRFFGLFGSSPGVVPSTSLAVNLYGTSTTIVYLSIPRC